MVPDGPRLPMRARLLRLPPRHISMTWGNCLWPSPCGIHPTHRDESSRWRKTPMNIHDYSHDSSYNLVIRPKCWWAMTVVTTCHNMSQLPLKIYAINHILIGVVINHYKPTLLSFQDVRWCSSHTFQLSNSSISTFSKYSALHAEHIWT